MYELNVIGNVTKDAVLSKTSTGKSVANFTVATNTVNISTGERKTHYVRCTIWNKMAENVAKYITKGRCVLVRGTPSPSYFVRQDGTIEAQQNCSVSILQFLDSQRNDPKPAIEEAPTA